MVPVHCYSSFFEINYQRLQVAKVNVGVHIATRAFLKKSNITVDVILAERHNKSIT